MEDLILIEGNGKMNIFKMLLYLTFRNNVVGGIMHGKREKAEKKQTEEGHDPLG